MIYLISSFHCCLLFDERCEIFPFVKYQVDEVIDKPCIVFGSESEIPVSLNFFDLAYKKKSNKNACVVEYKSNIYIFLFPTKQCLANIVSFKVKNFEISLSISNHLILNVEGETIINKKVDELAFSHYEMMGEYCCVYLKGTRDFLIVLKNKTLVYASFYDECNEADNEIYFLTKMNDSINHGKVFHITKSSSEDYLVYLDDFEMNLKDKFVPVVFLDCFVAGNYKYCNALLCEEIKLKDEKNIREFFPDFDEFFPIEEGVVVLIKNNTPSGVVEFQIKNTKIENLIIL